MEFRTYFLYFSVVCSHRFFNCFRPVVKWSRDYPPSFWITCRESRNAFSYRTQRHFLLSQLRDQGLTVFNTLLRGSNPVSFTYVTIPVYFVWFILPFVVGFGIVTSILWDIFKLLRVSSNPAILRLGPMHMLQFLFIILYLNFILNSWFYIHFSRS